MVHFCVVRGNLPLGRELGEEMLGVAERLEAFEPLAERRRLSKSLLPHVRAFYANYFDPDQHAPFYRESARQ